MCENEYSQLNSSNDMDEKAINNEPIEKLAEEKEQPLQQKPIIPNEQTLFPIYVPIFNISDYQNLKNNNTEQPQIQSPQQNILEKQVGFCHSFPDKTPNDTPRFANDVNDNQVNDKKHQATKHTKREKTLGLIAIMIVISFVFGIAGSAIYNLYFKEPFVQKAQVVINQSNDHKNLLGFNEEQVSLPQVIDATEDSVVAITTSAKANGTIMGQYVSKGAGSGVIISEDGYIITNTHVIETASSITVKLSNNQQFNATIIGTDVTTDISIIKINATGLKPATLGDSDKLLVGQTIIAIGNPLGELGGTVTTGIISALDRELSISGQSMNLLQISAAVNPGNSGGGLFNVNGELVGIVNAKSSGAEVEGLGFAIPINDIKDVIKQLIETGKVSDRPQLGVTVVEVEDMAMIHEFADSEIYNYIDSVGIYVVTSLDPNLKLGDKILAIDGETISQFSDIKKYIDKKKVGDTVEMTISRSKKVQSVTITLTEKH